MKHGFIRNISWKAHHDLAYLEDAAHLRSSLASVEEEIVETSASAPPTSTEVVQLTPTPRSAVEEAKVLLHIAAEVEGALLAEYLYAAYSILPGVIVSPPTTPIPLSSDDWYDLIRDIAKQEMGHLITVQNLLLSLGDLPHLDRENFPLNSDLYPFPFELQSLGLDFLSRSVTAEAPGVIPPSDVADYNEAAKRAGALGLKISRVGKIYERLYFLFKDSDAPQGPWNDVLNPFPDWPSWHISDAVLGFNQDRQAQPSEWRGDDATVPPDTAIYVLPVADKNSARQAIWRVAQQGEGSPPASGADTHFEKFLRIYREFRVYSSHPNLPAMARNQAINPTTIAGTTGFISDPVTLLWAQLANTRYQMLLMDIVLALSVGNLGSVTGTTATRRDFIAWAIGVEMLGGLKKLAEELRSMPMTQGSSGSLLAGLPFELPNMDLPATVPEQVKRLRELVSASTLLRANIRQSAKPTPRQQILLTTLDNADSSISRNIGR